MWNLSWTWLEVSQLSRILNPWLWLVHPALTTSFLWYEARSNLRVTTCLGELPQYQTSQTSHWLTTVWKLYCNLRWFSIFIRLLAVEDKEIENEATIGDKIVETLYSNRVTSKNKNFPHPFLSPPFKVRVFVVFYRSREQQQNIAWRGWGRKSYIFPFWSQ